MPSPNAVKVRFIRFKKDGTYKFNSNKTYVFRLARGQKYNGEKFVYVRNMKGRPQKVVVLEAIFLEKDEWLKHSNAAVDRKYFTRK